LGKKPQNAICGTKVTLDLEKLDYNLIEIFGEGMPGFLKSDKQFWSKAF
jgi:hypothetical protein